MTPAESASAPMVLHTRCVTGKGGGPEKTILNSPRFLAPLGYRSKCAYLHPPGDEGFELLEHRAERAGAELIGIADRGAFDLRAAWRMVRLCREENVAVWHGHDYKSNALGLLARRWHPMKLVTTVHGWVQHTRRTPLYYKIDKYCLHRYDEVICVSKDLYSECLSLGVPQSRCHLIHNGIDVEEYRRTMAPAEARAQLPTEAGQGVLIGAMGRLSEEKGFDLLIRAVARLRSEGLDVDLWIAGEGGGRDALQSLIHQLKLHRHVRLLGHVDPAKTFYEAVDIFALSSLREGLPNVLLEAMALETPVAATRIAGVPSLVSHEADGLLVEPGSVETLVDGLRRLVVDEQLRNRLAHEARATIERSFSFQQRMEKIGEIYGRLVAGERHTLSSEVIGV
jgi:glycosyltransferase involved in cell wall biosynthesis